MALGLPIPGFRNARPIVWVIVVSDPDHVGAEVSPGENRRRSPARTPQTATCRAASALFELEGPVGDLPSLVLPAVLFQADDERVAAEQRMRGLVHPPLERQPLLPAHRARPPCVSQQRSFRCRDAAAAKGEEPLGILGAENQAGQAAQFPGSRRYRDFGREPRLPLAPSVACRGAVAHEAEHRLPERVDAPFERQGLSDGDGLLVKRDSVHLLDRPAPDAAVEAPAGCGGLHAARPVLSERRRVERVVGHRPAAVKGRQAVSDLQQHGVRLIAVGIRKPVFDRMTHRVDRVGPEQAQAEILQFAVVEDCRPVGVVPRVEPRPTPLDPLPEARAAEHARRQ